MLGRQGLLPLDGDASGLGERVLVYGSMAIRWGKSFHDSWKYRDISAFERDTLGRLALNGDLYVRGIHWRFTKKMSEGEHSLRRGSRNCSS